METNISDLHSKNEEFQLEKFDDKAYSLVLRNKNLTFKDLEDLIEKNLNNFSNSISIDASFNKFEIIILKKFTNLTNLQLNNNAIKTFNLSVMPSIVVLDLSNNCISEISSKDFNVLGTLKYLNLSFNKISQFNKDTISHLIFLEKLDLSYNRIKFNTVNDFYDLIEEFDRNNKLLSDISMFKNVFSRNKCFVTKYAEYLKIYLKSTKFVNNQKVQEKDKSKGLQIMNLMKEIEEREIKNSSSFEKYVFKFETIMQNQFDFREKFKELVKEINFYLIDPSNKWKTLADMYNKSDDDTKYILRFFEYCKIANEQYPHFEELIKDLLVNIAIIQHGKWAYESFDLLYHLSLDNFKLTSDIEIIIIEGIFNNININPKQSDSTSKTFFVSNPLILKGLNIFCEIDYPELTKLVYKEIMEEYLTLNVKIFENYILKLDEPFKSGNMKEEDLVIQNKICFFKESIKALEKCLRENNTDILVTLDQDMFKRCMNLMFVFFEKEKDIGEKKKFLKYFNIQNKIILNLLSKLKFHYLKNTTSTIDNIMIYINKIKNSIKKYYNNQNYLFPTEKEVTMKNKPEQIIGHKTRQNISFSLKIKIYINLVMIFSEEYDNFFRNESEISQCCLNLFRFNYNEKEYHSDDNYFMKFDVVLIEASSYVVAFILKNIKFFSQNLIGFLNILGKFKEKIVLMLNFLKEKSNLFQMISKTSSIYDSKNYSLLQKRNLYEFKYISSIFMENLFITVLNSLLYIIKTSKKNELPDEIKIMLNDLNNKLDMEDRDNLIIDCLLIPSNEVKKMVIKCFVHTDYSQISEKEIRRLLETISEMNYLEGNMEEIIGNLFIFLNKIFIDSVINSTYEKIIMNFKAVDIAFEILSKSSERKSKNKLEFDNHQYLNLCLIIFLVNCSNNPVMKRAFDKEQFMTSLHIVLYNEYQYFDAFSYCPLEIEKSRVGNNFNNIAKLFKGEKAISPYSYISLRIFLHLADFLNNMPLKNYNITSDHSSDKIIDKIKKKTKANLCKRIAFEKLSWLEQKQHLKMKKTKKKKYQLGEIFFTDETEMKNELLNFSNNIMFLIDMLFGNESSIDNIIIFELMKNDKVDQNFYKINLKPNAGAATSYEEKDDIINNQFDIEINKVQRDVPTRNICDFTKFFMRTSDLPSGDSVGESNFSIMYSYIKNDIIITEEFGVGEMSIKRSKIFETVNNLYIRGLIFSAFLACIKSVLKCSYTSVRKVLLKNLRNKNNFLKLIMLIDSSKLLNFNIASKLLYIIRKIITNISFDNSKDNVNDVCIIFDIISFLIKKIIVVLNCYEGNDIKYKILIVQLIKLCLTVFREINFLSFDNKLKKNLMSHLISKKLINIFIKIIIEEMSISQNIHKKSENSSLLNSKKMNMIIIEIVKLLSEYMSNKESKSYYMIEKFNKLNIIQDVYIRNSFMKDLIGFSKMYKLMYKMKEILDKRIYMIGVCELMNYSTIFSNIYIYVMTDERLIFFKHTREFLKNSFDYNSMLIVEEETILIRNINKIYLTASPFRMFIKDSVRGDITMMFKRFYNVLQVCEFLVILNPRIQLSKVVRILFADHEKDGSDEEELDKSVISNTNKSILTEGSNNKNSDKETKEKTKHDKKQLSNKTNDLNHSDNDLDKTDKVILNKNNYYFEDGKEKLRKVSQFKTGFIKEYIQKNIKGIDMDKVNMENLKGENYDKEIQVAIKELKIDQEKNKNSNTDIQQERSKRVKMRSKLNLFSSKTMQQQTKKTTNNPIKIIKMLKYKMIDKNIFLVSLKLNNFCDYLLGYFNSDSILIPDPKLLYLRKNILYIYRENMKKLKSVPLDDDHFEAGLLGLISDCYELIGEYDLDKLQNIIFKTSLEITLIFSFKTLDMKFYGDFAYNKFRSFLVENIFLSKKNIKKIE